MFVITFEVTPSSMHPQRDEIGGAFVNCWMKRDSLDEAIADAKALVIAADFIADEPHEISEVMRENYDESSAELAYFEQAMIDDEVLVFHTFPVVDVSE